MAPAAVPMVAPGNKETPLQAVEGRLLHSLQKRVSHVNARQINCGSMREYLTHFFVLDCSFNENFSAQNTAQSTSQILVDKNCVLFKKKSFLSR